MASLSLNRVDARTRLKPRREPYWHRVSEGYHLGFRKMSKAAPGNWIARAHAEDGRYVTKPLGDFVDLEERARFDAARKAAEAWFDHLGKGGSAESITVKDSCERYVTRLRGERSEAAGDDAQAVFRRFVDSDPIARKDLAKLTPRDIEGWRGRLLTTDKSDPEAKAKSKAYVNRIMMPLRAALNAAYARRDVASDFAWKQGLKAMDAPSGRRTLYLDKDQRRALVDGTSDESKPLVKGLCLLPLRVGELAACKVNDFDPAHGILRVSGKVGSRDVPLSKDAVAHFRACAKNKLPNAWLVSRADGGQWSRFSWRDELKLGAAAAKLPRATCAYTIRHSVITDLVTGGLDIYTVAQVSGTSVAMIEKHYGKLRAEIARNALAGLSL